MSTSTIDIPIRMGREIDHIYHLELRKAKQHSDVSTFSIYSFNYTAEVLTLPLKAVAIPFQALSMLFGRKGLPSHAEKITADACRQRLQPLIDAYGDNDLRVVRQRNLIQLFEKMERIASEHRVAVEFYYDREAKASYSTHKCIVLDPKILLSEQDIAEAAIAGFIGNIKGWRSQKMLALKTIECALAFFAFFVIPDLFLPVMLTMFLVQSYASKKFVWQADLWAMNALGTNAGLVKYLKRRIECNEKYHPTNVPLPSFRYEGMSDEQVFEIRKAQVLGEPWLPWLVSRYESALNYQPRNG